MCYDYDTNDCLDQSELQDFLSVKLGEAGEAKIHRLPFATDEELDDAGYDSSDQNIASHFLAADTNEDGVLQNKEAKNWILAYLDDSLGNTDGLKSRYYRKTYRPAALGDRHVEGDWKLVITYDEFVAAFSSVTLKADITLDITEWEPPVIPPPPYVPDDHH